MLQYIVHMEVVFEDSQYNALRKRKKRKDPTLVRILKKLHIVKTTKQANVVMFFIALIFFSTSAYMIYQMINPVPAQERVYYEDLPQDVRDSLPPEILNTFPRKN